MKKIIGLILSLLIAGTAYADTCATSLMPAFTANQATKLCAVLGTSVAVSLIPQTDNAIDLGSASKGWRTLYADTSVITPLLYAPAASTLTFRAAADVNRTFTWSGGADTTLYMTMGDGTTGQITSIVTGDISTSDDGGIIISGGGDTSVDRGPFVWLKGDDVASTGGNLVLSTGSRAAADLDVRIQDDLLIGTVAGANLLTLTDGVDAIFGSAVTGQRMDFTSATVNTTDDNIYCVTGGGSCEDPARGGYLYLGGADVGGANAGDSILAATDDIRMYVNSGGILAFSMTDDQVKHFHAAADAVFESSATIGLQEATAGTKCMGTATANGTTAVPVATTCAITGSRIFISATSDGTGTLTNDQVQCWTTNIVNATSFDLDCADADNSATFNWIIFHETP